MIDQRLWELCWALNHCEFFRRCHTLPIKGAREIMEGAGMDSGCFSLFGETRTTAITENNRRYSFIC
jgi:hypothetical protein